MKKSEMIEIIGNLLFEEPIEADCADTAEKILEVVLKAGMVPPTMEFMMGNKLMRDNGWESENG